MRTTLKAALFGTGALLTIALYNEPAHAGPYAEFMKRLEHTREYINKKELQLSEAKAILRELEAYGRSQYNAIMDAITFDLKRVGDRQECRREIYARLQTAYKESDYPFTFRDRYDMLTTLNKVCG